MRKKEVYRVLEQIDYDTVLCELCNREISDNRPIEISSNKDSTILCDNCAQKFNNLSSFYDE